MEFLYGTPRKHNMLWHFLTPSRSTVIFGRPITPTREDYPEAIVTRLRDALEALSRHIPAR